MLAALGDRCCQWPAALLCLAACALLASAGDAAAQTGGPQLPSASKQTGAAPGSASAAPRLIVTRLSNLRSLSRWAYPETASTIRASPSARAGAVGRLRFLSPDEQAELYVVLASAHPPGGSTWLQIEVPARPNGRRGWVPRAALGPLHVVKSYLLIDQDTLTASLFREGREIFSARVGVGKPSTVTPAGEFYVLEKLRTAENPVYGPFALGTSAYAPTLSEWPGGGVVGIHGTNEPQLIPGRPSHGCIRLRDADMARLWSLIELGTPIQIS